MAKLFILKENKTLSVSYRIPRGGGIEPQLITHTWDLSNVFFGALTGRQTYPYTEHKLFIWLFTLGNVIPFSNVAQVPTGGTHTVYCNAYQLQSFGNSVQNSTLFGQNPIWDATEVANAISTINAMKGDGTVYYNVIEIDLSNVVQAGFKIECDFPFLLPNDQTDQNLTTFFDGNYWDLVELSGYFDNVDIITKIQNVPSWTMTYRYSVALLMEAFKLASGNTEYDYPVPSPFEPLPDSFYLTVSVKSDEEADGEQSLNYSWTPSNADDIDLSTITLHFRYERGNREYTEDVPYTARNFSTTYRDIVNNMGFEWWRNIISKIPLVGEQIAESSIDNYIYWSDNLGNSGSCILQLNYNGQNVVTRSEAQQADTGYWCYLTYGSGTDSQDWDMPNNPYSDLSGFGGGTDALNGSALLTTSYALTAANAHAFGSWLWGTGFDLDQLKLVVNNPIENIVSCKLFPFSVTGGTAENVKLGNVQSTVSGNKLPENVERMFVFGDIFIEGFYDNFLDYAPYTKLTLYLPYIGFKELDPTEVMGRYIQVRYYVDLVTGVCRAVVFSHGTETATENIFKPIASYDGVIGQDVPVVGSNRAQIEAGYVVGGAKVITDIASGIGAAITGNVGGALNSVGNAVSTGINSAMAMYHTYTEGTPSPAVSRFDEQKLYVIVNSPMYTEPTLYAHQNGKPCNLTCRLSELHGYTVIDNTVDLSSISCEAGERKEILNLLTSGIYL